MYLKDTKSIIHYKNPKKKFLGNLLTKKYFSKLCYQTEEFFKIVLLKHYIFLIVIY